MSINHNSDSEFTTLCRSQLTLLSQTLGAVWSVVYLTEEISENVQAQLFPFAIYPQTKTQNFFELSPVKLSEIWQTLPSHSIAKFLPHSLISETESLSDWESERSQAQQLILPLIHQETFIGLLVTRRDDRQWQQKELKQIEEIARTIAIARFLEFQYHWTQDELAIQENLRQIEHDRLDSLFHQLRNPLTALRTFGKLLLKRMLPNNANRKLAQSILAQGDRLQTLLEQFEIESTKLPEVNSSVSARMNSIPLLESNNNVDQSSFLLPSSPTELDSVDLKEILEPLLDTIQAISTERNIELVNHLPAIIPPVVGDLAALREILNNLLDNALKYTNSGGKVQLDLATSNDKMLGIVIKDTGSGIPLADQERIFERHYRGIQAQSDIPGTGLGLAIAQQLVTKMRGEIELISPNNLAKDSPGTTFIVWLVISEK
jgi:signal transduction histidine kinase